MKILRDNHIKQSDFDVWDYLSTLLDLYEYNKEEERFPMNYRRRRRTVPAYYLGKGVYCFHESDYEKAKCYDDDHDALIEIITDEPSTYINLSSPENKEKMISFLENEFVVFLEIGGFTPNERESYELIRKILLKSAKEDHIRFPHAAGVILELYTELTGDSFQLASSIFVLNPAEKEDIKKDEYFVIKDNSIITQFGYV